MKEKKIVLISSIIFLSIFLYFIIFNLIFYSVIVSASEDIQGYSQNEYLRIKIYGSTWDKDSNTTSGQFTILDANGNELAAVERSWKGSYIAVEFLALEIDGKEYIFPDCIYGKNRILEGKTQEDKGTSLSKYYLDNQMCLLPGNSSDKKNKKQLYRIAAFADSKIPTLYLGERRIYTVDLSKCKTGEFYSIIYDAQKGFSIEKY